MCLCRIQCRIMSFSFTLMVAFLSHLTLFLFLILFIFGLGHKVVDVTLSFFGECKDQIVINVLTTEGLVHQFQFSVYVDYRSLFHSLYRMIEGLLFSMYRLEYELTICLFFRSFWRARSFRWLIGYPWKAWELTTR